MDEEGFHRLDTPPDVYRSPFAYSLFESDCIGDMVDKFLEITAVNEDGAQVPSNPGDKAGELYDEATKVNASTPITQVANSYVRTLADTEFSDLTELTRVPSFEHFTNLSPLPNTTNIQVGNEENRSAISCFETANAANTSNVPTETGKQHNKDVLHSPLVDYSSNTHLIETITKVPGLAQYNKKNVNYDDQTSVRDNDVRTWTDLSNVVVEHSPVTMHCEISPLSSDARHTDAECSVDSGIESTCSGYLEDVNNVATSPMSESDPVKPKIKTARCRNSSEAILPPCRICGGKPSGLHYGAVTCEACKGFFRRTLKKKSVKFTCICNDPKKKGKDRRTKQDDPCQACRYQRCIAAGMSKNAIKIGRYTLDRKTQNILEVKKIEKNQLKSKGETCPAAIGQTSASDKSYPDQEMKPADSLTTVDASALATASPTKLVPTTKLANNVPLASVEICDAAGQYTTVDDDDLTVVEDELTVDEINAIVKSLVEKHFSLMEPWLKDAEVTAMKEQQNEYLEQYQLKKQMFGIMDSLSKEEYFNFYNSTGIDIDNRQDLVKEGLAFFQKKIVSLVEFAKAIPGFRTICLHDQANLIKSSRLDSQLIVAANRMVQQNENGITTTPWGKCYHIDEIAKVFPVDFIFLKMNQLKKIKKLDLSPEEEAVIRAITVTSPDRCDLEEPEKVHRIQCNMLTCLMHVLNQRTDKPNIRLSKIIDILVTIRTLSDSEAKILKELCLEWPMFSNHTFVREFIT